MMKIDKEFLGDLFEKAVANPRLRMNHDLRDSEDEVSQRMLNALLPGTKVPIHRHPRSSENIICLCGDMDVIFYKEDPLLSPLKGDDVLLKGGFEAEVTMKKVFVETERIHLCPSTAEFACVIPIGTWHSVEVYEPSVIYETKDGKYGEDGSEAIAN